MGLPDKEQRDPVYLHARRETLVIILLFTGFCIWSVAVCLTKGYVDSSETIDTTFGMPTWTFWGIFVPWLVVDVVAVWFCFFFMKADDLGAAHEDADLDEQRKSTGSEAKDD